MKLFGNTLIVAPVEPMECGQILRQYEPLPLHITLQPWFELPEADKAFLNALSNFVYEQRPFIAQRRDEEIFSHGKLVDIVTSGGGLGTLHSSLGRLITTYGGALNPSVTERPFRSHVSRVAGRQVADEIRVDSIQLVHRQADGNKLVGRRYPFGKRA